MKSTRSFTPTEVENLRKYKYSGTDNSIFSKLFLSRFWDWLINVFPLTLAANSITFIGFIFEFVSFIISFSFSDSLESRIPSWAKALNGISLFIYQTLDHLDGRQARRTGTSSALGHFFDHWCDSIAAFFIMFQVITTINLGNTSKSFFFVYLMSIGYSLNSYNKYVTHTFNHGYVNASDEGLLLLSILHIVVSIYFPFGEFIKNKVVYILYIVLAAISIIPMIYSVIKSSIGSAETRKRALVGIIPTAISVCLTSMMVAFHPISFKNTFLLFFSSLLLQYQSQLTTIAYLTNREPVRLFDPSLYIFWPILIFGNISEAICSLEIFWILASLILVVFIVVLDIGVVLDMSSVLQLPVFSALKVDSLNEPPVEDQNTIHLDIVDNDDDNDNDVKDELPLANKDNLEEVPGESIKDQNPL